MQDILATLQSRNVQAPPVIRSVAEGKLISVESLQTELVSVALKFYEPIEKCVAASLLTDCSETTCIDRLQALNRKSETISNTV